MPDGKYLSPEFVQSYAGRNPGWGFSGLGYIVYKRTYARPIPEEGRTEEWHETVARVVNGAQDIGAQFTEAEARRLFDYIWNLKGSVGGRMLWQLGTDNVKRLGGDSLVNCWYVDLAEVADFGWIFERLMLGGGVGFSVRNARSLGVVRQGRIVHEPDANDSDFIVPDKREGWADLLVRTLRCYLPKRESDYSEFTYSTKLIRPEGAPIKTFGGTASGPGILVDGVTRITEILDGAVGRHLTSTEVLDIANVIGAIVVSGNVRRSAQIALGDADDTGYLEAKRWDLGDIPSYRAMSNNSVYVRDTATLPEVFWDGYKGKGEPYGMVNLDSAILYGRMGEPKPDPTIAGFNPCAEIALANRESCNLAEVFLPRVDSYEELEDLTHLLYRVQKAVAALDYLDPVSSKITSTNMRLGLGVTGLLQSTDKLGWLSDAYESLAEYDKQWSARNGWPTSVRLTTVKPSGTLSLLAGVTPGAHPGFSRFHVRRVRMSYSDPLVNYCRAKGYNWEWQRDFEGNEDRRTVVVEFPCEFPESTIFADEMTAVEQLEVVRRLQREWADNAVSVTVYYRLEELPEIRSYLDEHWQEFKSASFLLSSEHGFDQAPLEAISEAEYRERLDRITEVEVEVSAGVSELLDDDCDTGACPIR